MVILSLNEFERRQYKIDAAKCMCWKIIILVYKKSEIVDEYALVLNKFDDIPLTVHQTWF